MADSAKRYYWLKLQEGFFSSKRIKKLRKIAGGDTYTIIYLKMQLLAMKNGGVLEYTGLEKTFADELALDLDEDAENVGVTVNYLLSCGLLETSDNKEFFVPYAVLNTGSESGSAKRVREHRERKALHCNADVTEVKQLGNGEIEIKKEIKKEKELDYDAAPDGANCTTIQTIIDAWNSLDISQITKIVSGTNRYKLLKARIKEYGVDAILEAIEKIKGSDFLMGRTGDGWTITFDWFVRPNNFPKVLGGNYDNKKGGESSGANTSTFGEIYGTVF